MDKISGVAVHALKINHGTNVCNTRFGKIAKIFAQNVNSKKYNNVQNADSIQRTGIAAGVEFIACPARNCCPIKI